MFSFDLFGDAELIAALDELPKSIEKSVLTGILLDAAQPVVEAAKALAPPDDPGSKGILKDSIAASTALTHSQKQAAANHGVTVFIGPSTKNPAYRVGHLNEFGTGPRYQKDGKYVGVMPAHPFMRPAWDGNKDRALQIIRERAWSKLAAAAKRLYARAQAGTLSKSVSRQLLGG